MKKQKDTDDRIQASHQSEAHALKVAEANARCLELQRENNQLRARVSLLEKYGDSSGVSHMDVDFRCT